MLPHHVPSQDIYFARINLVTICKYISRLSPLHRVPNGGEWDALIVPAFVGQEPAPSFRSFIDAVEFIAPVHRRQHLRGGRSHRVPRHGGLLSVSKSLQQKAGTGAGPSPADVHLI